MRALGLFVVALAFACRSPGVAEQRSPVDAGASVDAGAAPSPRSSAVVGRWHAVAFHHGDAVSRDPRSAMHFVIGADGAVEWRGQTTTEKRTTTGVQATTLTWVVTGLWEQKHEEKGDSLVMTWSADVEPTAAEAIGAWSLLAGRTSTFRSQVVPSTGRLWLHRPDVETSLELEAE